MTKPANFPGRQHHRRTLARNKLIGHLSLASAGTAEQSRIKQELATLNARLSEPWTAARAIRTKKDRSALGRFNRA